MDCRVMGESHVTPKKSMSRPILIQIGRRSKKQKGLDFLEGQAGAGIQKKKNK